MSKRELKKYLAELTKPQLEEQLQNMYDKFKDVKTYYDFVFNPREEKLIEAAKVKISNEYFPVKSRRPKLRRSVPQKLIKQFLVLEMDPFHLADLMLFAIEVAIKYSGKRDMKYSSFYKSIQNSISQVVQYVTDNGLAFDFKERLIKIEVEILEQNWENVFAISDIVAPLSY